MENTTPETKSNKTIVYAIIAVVVVLFGFVTYSVAKDIKNKNTMNDQNTATTTSSIQADRAAQAGDVIVINYSGKLENGTEFDSSYKRGQPFVFQIGVGQVIAGWDEGLLGVKKGDKKTLTISPDKGYGAQDIKDGNGKVVIPKNSTLIFDVEVVDVISKEDAERMVAEQQAKMQAQQATGTQQ